VNGHLLGLRLSGILGHFLVAHGCVRVESADMAWLGTHVHNGVPVRILS